MISVDDEYYNERYPDVAISGIDPQEHFKLYGKNEGRFPTAAAEQRGSSSWTASHLFARKNVVDQTFYFQRYPDVAKSSMTAVEHFTRYGRKEGRYPNAYSETRAESNGFTYRWGNHLKAVALAILKGVSEESHRAFMFEAASTGAVHRINIVAAINKLPRRVRDVCIYAAVLRTSFLLRCKNIPFSVKHIAEEGALSFCEPKVYGVNRPRPKRMVRIPSKWLATIPDATVIGAFQVIAKGQFLVYEPAANPHQSFVAGIWPYVASVKDLPDRALAWYPYSREVFLEEGILLSGRCSPNYYHWLIEYLGRGHILSQIPELRRVPLIVDDAMFPQEFESLKAVLPDWPIFRLPRSSLLKVAKLHIPSIGTYLPDSLDEPQWKGGAMCFEMLSFLRESTFRFFNVVPSDRPSGRKVYISRRVGRNVTNNSDVERLLSVRGYEIIDTAELSYEQQVRLFHSADTIVGAMGAAFTNLIFCNPGTKVLALSSPFTQKFCVQANMALFSGCSYLILAGKHPKYHPGGEDSVIDVNVFLDSYEIDLQDLSDALDKFEWAPPSI